MIKMGIAEGLKRTNEPNCNTSVLESLVNSWCERKMLKPLAIILPAYMANLGTAVDTNKLLSALHYLSATKCLDAVDQLAVEKLTTSMLPKL